MHFFAKGYTNALAVTTETPADAASATAQTTPAGENPATPAPAPTPTPTEGTSCVALKEAILGKTESAEASMRIASGGGSGRSPRERPRVAEPNRLVHTVVRGPEPGYVATPAIFIAVALCVLKERPR
jgi:hypothetical protein